MSTVTLEELQEFFERGEMEDLATLGGIEKLASDFKTDLKDGISATEAASNYAERRRRWGENVLPDPPTKTWCTLFLDTFKDLMLKILIAISLASILLTAIFSSDEGFIHFIDPIAILLCAMIVSCVTAQVNWTQQRAFLSVSRLKNEFFVNVIRGGEETQIMSTEILVGDLLSLKNGDAIPVDGLYLNGHAFRVNNSQTTGESVPVPVDANNPVVLSGTAVDSGDAVVLVCAVGKNSQFGVMMSKLQEMGEEAEKTPLEKKLDRIAVLITYMGAVGAALTFIVLFIIWLTEIVGQPWRKGFLTDLMDDLMVAFTIFIGAVPEGLPLAVVISLGFSMKKMMRDNNFVRHMNACETMGGATTICSDKTGTLTQNKMTVVVYHMDGEDYEPNPDLPKEIMDTIAASVAINTNAYMTIKEGMTTPEYVGKSTECALLKFICENGYDYKEIREAHPTLVLHDFNSTRKRMSSVVKWGEGYKVMAKGAPEIVIKKCTKYMKSTGEVVELDESVSDALIRRVNELADDQLRTMLITYADLPGTEFNDDWNDPANVERDLTIIGVCGIRDPLRPEVPKAIEDCKRAGVVVRMVTGDNINTAISIARQCGILSEDGHAMLGKEFSQMSKVQLIPLLPNLQVLARSSPLDKYRLVSLLMECGEVVAVTGDGSNDSTALRKANVGLAMGLCGTELAKMASDIVILDDNFMSIVAALKWGRCIYDNVRSFLQFQLTVNVCAMFITFVGSCVMQASPFRAIQLLWVSLIMDSIGALALATKAPFESLLDRPPYGESGALISRLMYRNIIVHALWQTALCLVVMFGANPFFKLGYNKDDESDRSLSSFLFNTFVFCQVFNLLNARVTDGKQSFWEGLFDNGFFWSLFIGIVVVQCILVEFGGIVFGTCHLGWSQWLWSVGLAATELICGAILRRIPIEDDTAARLILNREKKRDKMRKRYEGMTPSMMWRAPEVDDEEEEKKTKKNNKDEDLIHP